MGADDVLKFLTGIGGFTATAIILMKIILSVKMHAEEEEDGQHRKKDVVLKFQLSSKKNKTEDSEEHREKAISFVLDAIQRQTRLVIEEKRPSTKNDNEVFYLIEASNSTLCDLAEAANLRKCNVFGKWSKFTKSKMEEFTCTTIGTSETTVQEVVFESGERIRLIMEKLNEIVLEQNVEFGKSVVFQENRLLLEEAKKNELLIDIFPLHNKEELNVLTNSWLKIVGIKQPIDLIRSYFGDEIGFYFAFLGSYTKWLIPPALLGFLVFLFQWKYGSDTIFTAIYALALTVWATVFLEYWKRREHELNWQWNGSDHEATNKERPEFNGDLVYDDVEEKYVKKFPSKLKIRRYFFTIATLIFILLLLIIVMFIYFCIESWAAVNITIEKGYHNGFQHLVFLPGILYSILVIVFDTYYVQLALYLNNFENHRTDGQFSNALILKLSSFYFINNFGLLFYIAFFVRDFELLQQTLSSLLITRQVVGNVKEVIIPYFLAKRAAKSEKGANIDEATSSNKTDESMLGAHSGNTVTTESLMVVYDGTFDDYLELFVQFGQVTLFACAYPLAAFFALANNLIEIRGDAFKLCVNHRRPVPTGHSSGIGTWLFAFIGLGYVSVITNVVIIGFNSGQLQVFYPNIRHIEVFGCVVAAEHLLILVKLIVEVCVPDVPSGVEEEMRKEMVMLRKQADLQSELRERDYHFEFEQGTGVQEAMELSSENVKKLEEKENEEMGKWLAWVEEEKQRRLELEEEVSKLNELYMKWIQEEKSKRKKIQQKYDELRQQHVPKDKNI